MEAKGWVNGCVIKKIEVILSMKKFLFIGVLTLTITSLVAQTGCVPYSLTLTSDVANGGPTMVSYTVLNGNQILEMGQMSFDVNTPIVTDTFCNSGVCNLTLYIDPVTFPASGTFSSQISAFGAPLQFFNYQESNGVIVATFCATIPCPTSIQVQPSSCDTYGFYVPAYLPASNVSWEFGDGFFSSNTSPSQSHTYTEDGVYVVTAQVSNPGCGPTYPLLATVNVDCPEVILCPSQLILDTLSCQDYYLHFDTEAPGAVQWQIDGFEYTSNTAEFYIPFGNGWHEIIAIYMPTGDEGCTMGGCSTCPITFYDTLTVSCDICQPVFIGMTSVADLGGTNNINYTLSTLDGDLIDQNVASFSDVNPVVELSPCLADDCYLLHICSPTPLADSNFVVDVVEPLIIYQSTHFNVFGCYGMDVVLALNTDCAPPPPPLDTCNGEWLRWNTTASYLTMPPVFNPDTIQWSVTDALGNLLDQGVYGTTDTNPYYADSVCASLPLSCYFLHLTTNDQIWGATYLEVDASMDTIVFDNVWMNVVNPDVELDFLINPTSCPTHVDAEVRQDGMLYPNPAGDYIHYQGEHAFVQYEILDLSGKVIERHTASPPSIFVGNLSSGIYFLKTFSLEGAAVHSFVKE